MNSRPTSARPEGEAWVTLVDPRTARVTGEHRDDHNCAPGGGSFMSLMLQVHTALLLGPHGVHVVGAVAVLALLSVVSGLWLWWPPTGRLRHALAFKWNGSRARRLYDLHKHAGFCSACALIVLLGTGLYLTWPKPIEAAVSLVSPFAAWPGDVRSEPAAGRAPLSLSQAVAAADLVFSDGQIMGVSLPAGPADTYCVRRRAPGEVTRAYTHRQVWIDQYSGGVRAVTDPRTYNAGTKFLEWQYPVHSGEAFGLVGELAVFAAGLVPALLFVTGIIRWRAKRRSASSQPAPIS